MCTILMVFSPFFFTSDLAALARSMLRRTLCAHYLGVLRNIPRPPISGYEIAELPNERVLREYLNVHKEKLVIAILHSGCYPRIKDDPITSCFVGTLNLQNYGDPHLVRMALVPGPQCTKLLDEHNVLTFPTTLLFHNGAVFDRVLGARGRELSIKCLFKLRNEGLNIFARR